MKILVVGGGGREHAIIKALKRSPRVTELFCAPGNGGIAAEAVCVPIEAVDIGEMVSFARRERIDLVVVTPDNPLVLGMVDELERAGIPAFGPNQAAAAIEGSKVFAKRLMQTYGIPTARHESFSSEEAAIAFLEARDRWPVVVKADGLALGKGVVIAESLSEAKDAVRQMMRDKIFGESGSQIVLEDCLTGPEVSVLAFCDGNTLLPMVSSMDHKRAFEGNRGPNTGGMGTVAPNPHYTPDIAHRCMEEIFLPTLRAMKAEGRPFQGCLYFGLMLTPEGPMVIEYNCRFGDPEAQVVLPLLETDLLELMLATREGRLHEVPIRWKRGTAACVVLASGGYPGSYPKGLPITGLEENGNLSGVEICHAGTKREGGGFVTAGGRVLNVCATGDTLPQALETAYAKAGSIHFDGMRYRADIGAY